MKIRQTAYVARTAHDQTHGNKLVLPEFGVISVYLKAAGSESKTYLPASSIPPRAARTAGTEDFCFAPGTQWTEASWQEDKSKTDKVKVCYHLFNPFSQIENAKIELFRRFDQKPFWERKLKDDELLDGEHELEFETEDGNKVKEWDGSLGKKKSDYPDGFVTTEHSPYKMRITVEGDGLCKSPAAWTYFHILIEELKLEWGPDEAVQKKEELRKVFTTMKADFPDPKTPTIAAPARIYLESNIFKKNSKEMFDNTLFKEYKKKWSKTPEIALFAKIYVRDSAGAKVIAPKALGNTKFLWDWENALPDSTTAFVTNAQNYEKDTTKPKGQNCHKDRGGLREKDKLKLISAHGGYKAADTLKDGSFPFEVKHVKKPRVWAAYSKAWREGKLAAKTGILFQPSRMAGDAYKFTVYAAHEIVDSKREPRLNVDSDAPLKIDAKLKAESGILQVWRKLHFRRYMTKNGATTTGWPGIKAFYEKAFLDIEDKTTGVENYPAGDWNTAASGVINGWNATDQLKVDSAVNQHASGQHGIHFRTRSQFSAALGTAYAAFFATYPGGQAQWMIDNNLDTTAKYAATCQTLAMTGLVTIFDKKMPADDGIALFHVDYSINSNLISAMNSFTDGQAADFPSGGRNKCAFLWTAPSSLYGAQGPAATPAHEIGHHMMLPHPRNTGENNAPDGDPNNDYDAHDRAVSNCLMSYLAGARELCGLCQLRQRGWDKSKLSPDGNNNK